MPMPMPCFIAVNHILGDRLSHGHAVVIFYKKTVAYFDFDFSDWLRIRIISQSKPRPKYVNHFNFFRLDLN